jgi:hypothetical protein
MLASYQLEVPIDRNIFFLINSAKIDPHFRTNLDYDEKTYQAIGAVRFKFEKLQLATS